MVMSFLEELPRPFFVLAPMDDVTDVVFRQIVAECAKPDISFTEFVNVDGLQSPGREKLLHKLKLSENEGPVIAQLWGLKPENFYKTVKELVDGTLVAEANALQGKDEKRSFAGVDLNMGCPVKTVIKNGACAALINNRELAGEIIDAAKQAAGEDFPVSVKTRVGFTTIDMSWIEFLLSKKILNMLSIHGRTAKELSSVPANWDLVGQARQLRDSLSPSTLIVGNGDVMSRQQGEELAQKYKLDGIMIGRGIFHDPFAFAEHSPWARWSEAQKLELFRRHIELYLDTYKKNERRFEALRKFCKLYISGFDDASELRARFMETKTPQQVLQLLN
ncbi:tRNA-dihydrouridine synthase [Candidatus Saccharibacteria bacterium]|nr:tRNA-dihydrouridine synthase [Candidatus Saccharibacteria bacterium]